MIESLPFSFPSNFQISQGEVLGCAIKQRKRRATLFTAVSLNSLYASKCIVWVTGQDQCIGLYGQVLAFSERQVIMDRGVVIPTTAICKVDLTDNGIFLS